MTKYIIEIADIIKDVSILFKYLNKFKLIICDPPFNIEYSQQGHRCHGAKSEEYYDDVFEDYEKFIFDLINVAYKCLTEDGSIVVFSGCTNFRDVLNAFHESKFFFKNHICWQYGFGLFMKNRYVFSHYDVVWGTKKDNDYVFNPEMTGAKGSKYELDVFDWSNYNRALNPDKVDGHPCQLPTDLLRKIIRIHSNEGDWIGDFCAGSGSTAKAALKEERNVVCVEKNPKYKKVILDKISEEDDGFNLF